MDMKTDTTRNIVILVIVGTWVITLIIAAFDGNTALKAATPMLTMAFGWLFAARATS